MNKIKYYQRYECAICGRIFDHELLVSECYHSHKQPKELGKSTYIKGRKYPNTIAVIMEDGKEVKYTLVNQ